MATKITVDSNTAPVTPSRLVECGDVFMGNITGRLVIACENNSFYTIGSRSDVHKGGQIAGSTWKGKTLRDVESFENFTHIPALILTIG